MSTTDSCVLFGPPGTGKSLAAERLMVDSTVKPMYIATLPNIDRWASRIEAHKTQRSVKFLPIIETFGSEMALCEQLTATELRGDGILLDGLSALCWGYVLNHRANRAALETYCDLVATLLFDLSVTRTVIIVDCDVPFPSMDRDYWFNQVMENLHEKLTNRFCFRRLRPRLGGF